MPPDPEPRAQAAEWLAHAKSNLILARSPKPDGVLWDHLCFEAQQAAEKAVKAALVAREIEFPATHDIGALLTCLESGEHGILEDLWEAAAVLTPYAVLARYPGFDPPASEEAHRQALAMAEQVVRWAEAIIRGA